jgi:hypothetical protein
MRFLFLIPELIKDDVRGRAIDWVQRRSQLSNLPGVRDWIVHPGLFTTVAFGGTLNIMRHCALARRLGADAGLMTPRGGDTYGRFNVVDAPFYAWSDIRRDDVCVIPDFCSDLVNRFDNRAIVYLQAPGRLVANFDYLNPRVRLWTDSPFMLEQCREVFPGKDIPIVPNIVDPETFPFRAQSERAPGLLLAFPRKGPEFIEATRVAYEQAGGRYWRFELVDGVSLFELARRMRRPQAFLASGEDEGCALPPQECMAAGIVVVGRSARGANFSMEHRRTAMIANTPEEAAVALRELEEQELRDTIARNGWDFIRRYFPDAEPAEFWRSTLGELGVAAP